MKPIGKKKASDDTAETQAEDPKKAEKKDKPKKEKKPKDNTFTSAFIIILASGLLAAVISSGVSLWMVQEDINKNNSAQQSSALETYIKAVNTNIELLQKEVDILAKDYSRDPDIEEMGQETLDRFIADGKLFLPEALDVKIFPFGRHELDTEAYPPVNYAAQKLLLQAEKNEGNFPEFNKHQNGDYFNMTAAVYSPSNNELLLTILVSYPSEKILHSLPKSQLENTSIAIIQEFAKGEYQDVFKTGAFSPSKQFEEVTKKTIHPKWKVQYKSNNAEKSLNKSAMFTAVSIPLNFIILLIAVLISTSLLKKKFTNDSNLIFEYLRSDNKKPISKKLFKTSLLLSFYKDISKLSFSSGSQPRAASKKSGQTNALLDIEIAEGDENLFGSEEESNIGGDSAAGSISLDPTIFRAYDIRGIVGSTLNADIVKQIGQSIGSEALDQGQDTIVIARDGRLSGPELIEALAEGIQSSGANVTDIGMVPTPLLYFACKTFDTKTGVMLTGSHNPANHNGLKIVMNGKTLYGDDIQKLRTNIENKALKSGNGTRSQEDVIESYVDAVVNDVILAHPIDIVIDCGNGVTGVIAERLFTEIGCNVTMLCGEVDGNFPNHHPDPSRPDNLKLLQSKVQETNAALGIAFDGDGDRLGVVTNQGKIIWPDRLLMLYAKDILLRSPGADIIFDVKCSQTLADTISDLGGRPLMWKTGHSLIKAKLQETGAQLAGEMSGHVFFNDRWYGFDDGLYSASRLLEILTTDTQTSDQIFAAFPEKVSTPEINIPIADDAKFDLIDVLKSLGEFGDGVKTDIDGIRIDYSYGWGLVRPSNTSAVLVTRFEADTEEQLKQIQGVFKEQLLKIENTLELPF